jgi:hypothetical protein
MLNWRLNQVELESGVSTHDILVASSLKELCEYINEVFSETHTAGVNMALIGAPFHYYPTDGPAWAQSIVCTILKG